MSTYNASEESASPPAPASGRKLLYPKALGWFSKDSGGSEKQISPLLGEIKIYAGSIAPDGWALCNGYAISRAVYSGLFAVIGTTYGIGDGSTTFNLPNLQNKFPIMTGVGHGLGTSGGAETVELSTANLPSHTHAATFTGTGGSAVQLQVSTLPLGSTGTPGNGYYLAAQKAVGGQPLFVPDDPIPTTTINLGGLSGGGITGGTIDVASVGGGDSVDILPPFLALNFIIAVL